MVIAAWNYYSCDRLVLCRELLDSVASGAEDLEPNAVYPYIGRKAFGPWGECRAIIRHHVAAIPPALTRLWLLLSRGKLWV